MRGAPAVSTLQTVLRIAWFFCLLFAACGSKTGLPIPEEELDAAIDATFETDASPKPIVPDAGNQLCVPQVLPLVARPAEVILTIDASASMGFGLEGQIEEVPPGERRWDLLVNAFSASLDKSLPIAYGAKLYPSSSGGAGGGFFPQCRVAEGLELAPSSQTGPLLSLLFSTVPDGGTPTTAALRQVKRFFDFNPSDRRRFVILATDGAPNCNPFPVVGPPECTCTNPGNSEEEPSPCERDFFQAATFCLDDLASLDAIESLRSIDVPVFVIGIDDPSRPDFSDLLSRMAVAGGEPLPKTEPFRFYSIREPEDLGLAFESIANRISRCLFDLGSASKGSVPVEVQLDGVPLPRDPKDGWELVDDGNALVVFGSACELVSNGAVLSAQSAVCLSD
ncbi:MAG: hypothetical protein AAF355_10585 [Myxococcota bacterium]